MRAVIDTIDTNIESYMNKLAPFLKPVTTDETPIKQECEVESSCIIMSIELGPKEMVHKYKDKACIAIIHVGLCKEVSNIIVLIKQVSILFEDDD